MKTLVARGTVRRAGLAFAPGKWLLLAGLVSVVLAFFHLGLAEVLTLEALKAKQDSFDAIYRASPITVIAAFFVIYVVVAATSLPGAAVLTLAAGALFGLVQGTIIVSFASSIGAALAFLAARYLFGAAAQARLGGRLEAFNAGVANKDGAFYLLTLRLVPIFPFFLVNLAMGLTSIRLWTYYWVSQFGMLLGTIIYVNAGTQLARIDSITDIAAPGLLLSFSALGVAPWVARAVVGRIKARRVYARWRKPRRFDRNIIVIGAGAAGLVSAYIAATVKARVSLVEAAKMGGDCLNFGCVPSKALIRTAKLAQQIREGARFGLQDAEPAIRFKRVMHRVQDVVRAIQPHDSIERYTSLGVDVIEGHARVIDPWTVEITTRGGAARRLTTRTIVIAAGAAPYVPPLPGIEDTGYVTSDTLWETFASLDQPPPRLLILGGGAIGCELAQCFARLGSSVTLVERDERLLPREDPEVSHFVEHLFETTGITALTCHEAVRCERSHDGKRLVLAFNGEEHNVEFDALLVAVGREARLSGYGLETLGIETERTIITNDRLQTLYPNIYAAGDVAGPHQFTHVAAHQAWFATVNALFGRFKTFKADYRFVPRTIFLDPEIAQLGMTEREAGDRGIACEVTRFELAELDRAIVEGATTGFVKILTAPGKDRILGVTIVGEHAGELIAEYVLAMKHGLGLSKILGTVHSYPTFSEANKYAAGAWKRAHAPEALLRLAGRYHQWMRG